MQKNRNKIKTLLFFNLLGLLQENYSYIRFYLMQSALCI